METTCPRCWRLRGAWLTEILWALLLVGGQQPRVNGVGRADGLSMGATVGGRPCVHDIGGADGLSMGATVGGRTELMLGGPVQNM